MARTVNSFICSPVDFVALNYSMNNVYSRSLEGVATTCVHEKLQSVTIQLCLSSLSHALYPNRVTSGRSTEATLTFPPLDRLLVYQYVMFKFISSGFVIKDIVQT